jgi:hypothetical protein
MAGFAEAIRQKDRRVKLKNITCKLDEVSFTDEKELFFQGRMHIAEKGINDDIRRHIAIALQLRRKKRLEDVLVPLETGWIDERTIRFRGRISCTHIPKGSWEVYLSVSCLNDHLWVRPSIPEAAAIPAGKNRSGRTVFRFFGDPGCPMLKVYRAEQKEPVNFRRMLKLSYMRYMAKMRDMIQEFI